MVLAAIGPGIPIYLVAWLVMPRPGEELSAGLSAGLSADPRTTSSHNSRSEQTRKGVGLGLLVLGSALAVRELDLAPPDTVVLPVLLVGLGLGVVMWQLQSRHRADRWVASRIATGVVVVGIGVGAFVAGNISLGVMRDGLLATLLVTGGLGLIIGPWMAVLIRSRQEERHRRLQADARSDMAAHLHDSVLQTFAMIQKADDVKTMSGLARRQERELRRWLYGSETTDGAASLESATEAMVAAVEELHGITVESVVVGDRPLDINTEALLAAASEAVTNAAKWSGRERVSMFVEADSNGVHAYVRDTGVGFDQSVVAPDRLGLRESIHGRMERVGGTVEINTELGAGTEVHLFVPTPRA